MDFEKKKREGFSIPELLPHFRQPFFEHASHFPFRPDLTRYSAVNAWWLAEASGLAYFDEAFVKETLGPDFEVTFFENLDTETQGFMMSRDNYCILAFRGTEVALLPDLPVRIKDPIPMLRDIIVDLDMNLEEWDGHGRVHSGFLKSFVAIFPEVREAIDRIQPKTIWVTGHSLGGAIAALVADALHRASYGVRGLYTIGAARPGDPGFARHFRVPAYRFVHQKDVLSLLPPDIFLVQDYTPVGTLMYLDDKGHIHPQGGKERQLMPFLAQELGLGVSAFLTGNWSAASDAEVARLITHHSPIYYRNHLWNDMIV